MQHRSLLGEPPFHWQLLHSMLYVPHSQLGGSLALQGFGIRKAVREPWPFCPLPWEYLIAYLTCVCNHLWSSASMRQISKGIKLHSTKAKCSYLSTSQQHIIFLENAYIWEENNLEILYFILYFKMEAASLGLKLVS